MPEYCDSEPNFIEAVSQDSKSREVESKNLQGIKDALFKSIKKIDPPNKSRKTNNNDLIMKRKSVTEGLFSDIKKSIDHSKLNISF
jgi:hypothetical protein